MSTKRIQAIVKVNPTDIPLVIGRNGTNIQRILRVVGNGCYIEGVVENGKGVFKVSAYKEEVVKHAMKELASEIKAIRIRETAKQSEVATEMIPVEPTMISKFIGLKGIGLRRLEHKIGKGCYLVVNNNQLVVRTETSADLPRAITMAKEAIDNMVRPQPQSQPTIVPKQVKQVVSKSSPNRFDVLEDEEPTIVPTTTTYAKVAQTPVPKSPWEGTALTPPKTISMTAVDFPRLSEKVPTMDHRGVWKDEKKVDEIRETIPTSVFTPLKPSPEELRLQMEKEALERRARQPLMLDLTELSDEDSETGPMLCIYNTPFRGRWAERNDSDDEDRDTE